MLAFARNMGLGTALFMVCFMVTTSAMATDRADRARALIENLANNAKTILTNPNKTLEERESQLVEVISGDFHIPFISQFVIGPEWSALTDKQKADFLELFQDFFLRAYSGQLGGYPDEELVILSALKKGSKDSFVVTKLQRPARQTVNVRWRIREFNEKPLIIDLWIDGASVDLNHRRVFSKVISRGGVDGLIELLKIRAERLSAQPSG